MAINLDDLTPDILLAEIKRDLITRAAIVRSLKAVVLRIRGLTFREIGQTIGRVDDSTTPVSLERARQMYSRGVRYLYGVRVRRKRYH